MYKYIYLVLATILFPLMVFAANDDVSLSAGVRVGPYDLIISGTANIESIVTDTTNITITMPAGSSIHIESPSKHILSVSGIDSSYITQQQCGNSYALVMTIPSGASTQTVVVTPSTDFCSSGGGGNSTGSNITSNTSSGSTPSVSSSSSNSNVSVTTTPVSSPVITPVVTPIIIQISFLSDLSKGDTNSDVTKLQQFLAKDKTLYPEGLVTGYYGPATERAVKKFQAKYGISQVGRVGPATRAKLNEVYSTTPVAPSTPATVVPSAPVSSFAVFTRNLRKGSSGDDVKRLQQFLNIDVDTRVATEGVGSTGNETTLFGSLTEKAVQKFQVKYGIAKEGDEGYGQVGPKTRAKLNEIGG